MNICSEGHDEIVYNGRVCPLCAEIKERQLEKDDLEDKIDEIRDVISN